MNSHKNFFCPMIIRFIRKIKPHCFINRAHCDTSFQVLPLPYILTRLLYLIYICFYKLCFKCLLTNCLALSKASLIFFVSFLPALSLSGRPLPPPPPFLSASSIKWPA